MAADSGGGGGRGKLQQQQLSLRNVSGGERQEQAQVRQCAMAELTRGTASQEAQGLGLAWKWG
jgi:hypothetical protein